MNVIELLKERIQDELYNKHKSRTVIFWYDEQEEYTLEQLKAALEDQPIQVRKLTLNNFFTLKLEIELKQREQSFLLYANFAKPAKKDNFLLDMELYGTEFKADTTAILADQLDVNESDLRGLMQLYEGFFKSTERKNKLKKVLVPKADERNIKYAMLAVLTGAPIANMEEITRHLLIQGLEEDSNEAYKSIEKRFSTDVMWGFLTDYFGIHQSGVTLQHLMEHILFAHFQRYAHFEEPTLYKKYETTRSNACALFIDDWLHTKEQEVEVLELYIKEIEQRFNLAVVLYDRPIEQYAEVDTFPLIDIFLAEKLTLELIHQTSNLQLWKTILNKRLKMHWAKSNKHIRSLLNVLVEAVNLTIYKTYIKQYDTREPLYVQYANELYLIDQAYRRFITSYMQLEQKDRLDPLAKQLTAWYENRYLVKVAEETNYLLESQETGKLPKQVDFYRDTIQPIIEKESTRVFVIISDAVRYEIGEEIALKLNLRSNGQATISPMIANLPSYTQLGMASLLPHKELTLDRGKKVYADGFPTDGLANRVRILQNAHPEAIAYRLNDLLNWSRAEAEEHLKGKRLVYLYHDIIDATGDSIKSESDTYNAVQRAIEVLIGAVDRLSRLQAKRVFITADHGFLYQRLKVENDGKVASVNGEVSDGNRRFAIGSNLFIEAGAIKITDKLSTLKGVDRVVAKGLNRFIGGGGLQFIHGSATPQEAIVPLVDYRRTSQAVPVDISVAMPKRVITSYRIQVPMYQEQSISTDYMARTIRAAFYLNGERISNEIEWTFNMIGDNHERNETLIFNLIEQTYVTGQICELRMLMIEDGKFIPYRNTEFTIHMYNAIY